MTIKVLVVDDSVLMRSLLTEVINACPNLEVVGQAPDPLVAREMIKSLNPDVLTLDVEMPRMDGLDFLGRLMRLRPMPVVMISSLTVRGSEVTLQALELGAVDFIGKPRMDHPAAVEAFRQEVGDKLRAAYSARLRPALRPGGGNAGAAPAVTPASGDFAAADRVIFIGASTGGTEAIKDVLCGLPASMPPILMVQHMPEAFTPSFARRLDGACALRVKEAEDGERLQPGTAYLAPGHSHLLIRKANGAYVCGLSQAEPVNRHRPAVDVLFQSAAQCVGRKALGVILTGMGKDGAQGMLAMRQAGAWTVGQDQDSCVVYGMPREAAQVGALEEVAPLREVAARVLARLRGQGAGRM
ncbi:chemotaxis response regulator protein-glutamate methylesterase [Zoogloea sp.]|uniref:protein-glutamate methylesterase/protein-glutamine glutaminase n=1 Tax=Zoogloea sp. TaxID=49181 RepID=UPI0035B03EC4|nr:chemotaxis response regulator protein-glutamate methylesterase [Rhodocyclales bacterium]